MLEPYWQMLLSRLTNVAAALTFVMHPNTSRFSASHNVASICHDDMPYTSLPSGSSHLKRFMVCESEHGSTLSAGHGRDLAWLHILLPDGKLCHG